MKRSATVFAAVLLLSQTAFAATAAHDGAWWAKLPHGARIAVLDGLMEGYVRGWAAEHYRVRGLNESGRSPWWANDYVMRRPPGFRKPMASYLTAIDRFYATHRDARYVPVVNVLDCLSDPPTRSCSAVALDADIIIR